MPPGCDWPEESTIGDEASTSGESDSSNDPHQAKCPPHRTRRGPSRAPQPSSQRRRRDSGVGQQKGSDKRERKDSQRGYYYPRQGLDELRAEQERRREKVEAEGGREREERGSTREESIPGTYYIYNATTKEYFPFPKHLDYDPTTSQIFKRRTKHRGPEETARKEENSSSRSLDVKQRPASSASSSRSYHTKQSRGGSEYHTTSSATSEEESRRPLKGFTANYNYRGSQSATQHGHPEDYEHTERTRRTRPTVPPPAAYYNQTFNFTRRYSSGY